MKVKKIYFIIPHKRNDDHLIVEKEIMGSADIPVEKVILEIISRIYKEGVNAS